MTAGTFPSRQLPRLQYRQINQYPKSYNSYSCWEEQPFPSELVSAASPVIESLCCNRSIILYRAGKLAKNRFTSCIVAIIMPDSLQLHLDLLVETRYISSKVFLQIV
jgi:hypothetical protein